MAALGGKRTLAHTHTLKSYRGTAFDNCPPGTTFGSHLQRWVELPIVRLSQLKNNLVSLPIGVLEMQFRKHGLAVLAATLSVSTSVFAAEVKTEAVIVSVDGSTIHARTRSGPLTIVLTPSTKIAETSGLARKDARDARSLLPGLIFTVKGDQQGQTVTAEAITFKERDWKTAVATKAGTAEQFSELRRAIIEGNEYVIREEATVYFPSGSAVIGKSYTQKLRELAQKAPSYGNYRISILGFADSRGNAAANERLSQKRALAVSNYLRQTGSIQPGRVLSPSAMGEGTAAPGEAAPTTPDEARRVVVRVVTPKTQLTK
jgi:outer membrane protein OmpA-like peptidoglycan-associated protein